MPDPRDDAIEDLVQLYEIFCERPVTNDPEVAVLLNHAWEALKRSGDL